MSSALIVRRVTPSEVPRVASFLEAHLETSLFLLASLVDNGPDLGEALNSGNFKLVAEGTEIVAVFVLNRRGGLHVQLGERGDVAPSIARACHGEPIAVKAVLGGWANTQAVWAALCREPGFVPKWVSKEILYRLALTAGPRARTSAHRVRPLVPGDFEAWETLVAAFYAEDGRELEGTLELRRANFTRLTEAGRAWGASDAGELVSIAAFHAVHGTQALVGGMYTTRAARRRGFARAVMETVITEGRSVHGLETFTLFTPEDNLAARPLYESLGFLPLGHFGICFRAAGP